MHTRTLLVDNYDSFTHNLFHLLADVCGTEPEVIRNDEPGWRPALLRDFDAVVLSPGPGTPCRAADLGHGADLARHCDLPLLGICLGHQGIGHAHGATVDRAPEPVHGRTAEVHHHGRDLFAGLPTPFRAVRYHSLAVTGLPPHLRATAWTADGVLMGLRHRDRPVWGVQFHPESVCTEYGRELLGNFVRLARSEDPRRVPGHIPRQRTAAPRPPSGPPAGHSAGEPAGEPAAPDRRLRVLHRRVPRRWDAEAAYDLLFRGLDHSFWLDSSRPGGEFGRFSVLGSADGPLGRIARADVAAGTVTVTGAGATEVLTTPFLDWIDADLRARQVELPDLPGDFALGWVGWLGYELKAQCGGEAPHRAEDPDAAMVFADRAVLIDHLGGDAHLLALGADRATDRQARVWLDDTARRLEQLAGQPPAPAPAPAPPVPAPAAPVRLRHDRDHYLRLVRACQEEIAAGETYEVCLTNMAEAEGEFDAWQSYRLLRRAHPAPFAALLQFDRTAVLSTSPERFLRVDRGGLAESRPIKGTRPRGGSPEHDDALRDELAHDPKDRAENLMIVDLVRNDLGRCARPGSVRVPRLFEVERHASVHQLVSTVRAQLAPGRSAVDCVRAAFPGGSMTGAPKIRTMRLIDRLEEGPRGVYSGALGYFSLSGAADFSIVIRTAVITPGRLRYGTGGAVTALSDPAAEFEETMVKSAPLHTLLGTPLPEAVR
ncbi:aminodeoxychorismate synthase component I [Kitasatospora sp. NPDC088391]|uniref:aminodeoxychorismate synthase component I n=1 Tax=Kitasatospora sp. NPDC088391 TaxID=3364074 RepID=UPI003815B53A